MRLTEKYATLYQILLVLFALVVIALLGFFAYREMHPEYKRYQSTYTEVERIRADEDGTPPPKFRSGIKQLLFQPGDVGPEQIDRCVSCHVATNLPAFSPTLIQRDINGEIVRNAEGVPLQTANPDYVWSDPRIEGLRYQEVEGERVDMAKVLAMHPLIGRETRPFEYHPVEEYGCTTCHGGNGRSVTKQRAHGPVYDGDYATDHHTVVSPFIEPDQPHDPAVARIYNAKPDDELLFQTTPLLPGHLMEARCAQCHQDQTKQLSSLTKQLTRQHQHRIESSRCSQGLQPSRQPCSHLPPLGCRISYWRFLAHLRR
jgi:hypothetical protein